MDNLNGEGGVLLCVCLEVEVKRANPLCLDGVVEVWLLVKLAVVHELLLDEAVIVERVCECRLGTITLPDRQLDKAWDVDVH